MKQKNDSMKMFLILLGGQFLSSIGSGLTDFGLAIFALKLTGSVTASAMISICAFLPSILFAPLGGVLADRYDRRSMMLLGELLSGLGLVVCFFAVNSSHPSMLLICVSVGVSSVFTALTEPAFKATITDMISAEDYAKAGGLVQIANNAKLLISPALAGLLLTVTGVGTLLLIDILTFFTTALTILLVQKSIGRQAREAVSGSVFTELKEGAEALKGKKGIWSLILIMTVAVFALGFVQILSKPLILAYAGEKALGILTTVVACGMLAGSIGVSCIKGQPAYNRMLAAGLAGCGLFMAFMAVWENVGLAAVFGFLMFVCMPVVQIGAEVMIRKNLKNEVQGRAFGLIGFVSQLGYIVAYLLSGVLSDYIFEPFMKGSSLAALKIGAVIGNGAGRGIALLIILAGTLMAVIGIVVWNSRAIKELVWETGREKENEAVMEYGVEGYTQE